MGTEGLLWGENVWMEIGDADQLDALLDRLADVAADEPFVVELSLQGHGSLGLGLGAERCILTYVPEHAARLVAHARPAPVPRPSPFRFRFRGDISDFPADAGIDGDVAREAMRRFLVDGQPPDDVDWTEG